MAGYVENPLGEVPAQPGETAARIEGSVEEEGSRVLSSDRRGQKLPRSARAVADGLTSEQVMGGRRTPTEKD